MILSCITGNVGSILTRSPDKNSGYLGLLLLQHFFSIPPGDLRELCMKMYLKCCSNYYYYYFLTWTRRCLGLGPLLRYPISCSWRSLWERKTAANQWNRLTETSRRCMATQRHVCPPQAQLDNTEPMLQAGVTLPDAKWNSFNTDSSSVLLFHDYVFTFSQYPNLPSC